MSRSSEDHISIRLIFSTKAAMNFHLFVASDKRYTDIMSAINTMAKLRLAPNESKSW